MLNFSKFKQIMIVHILSLKESLLKFFKRLLKFCRSGEISPNLVTLPPSESGCGSKFPSWGFLQLSLIPSLILVKLVGPRILKKGHSRPLYVHLCSFQVIFTQNNWRLQRDSHSDHRSRRWERWPLTPTAAHGGNGVYHHQSLIHFWHKTVSFSLSWSLNRIFLNGPFPASF